MSSLWYFVTAALENEYPLAKQEGKLILSAELVPTDKEKLTENYEGLPTPVDAHNEVELSQALLENIKKLAIKENDGSPEHNFFIGLAYLNGIDVEIDPEKAVSLITYAAENDCDEAMQKLVDIYTTGNGVARDYSKAIEWKEKIDRKIYNDLVADFNYLKNEIYMSFGQRERYMNMFLRFQDDLRMWHILRLELSELYKCMGDVVVAMWTLNRTINLKSFLEMYQICMLLRLLLVRMCLIL